MFDGATSAVVRTLGAVVRRRRLAALAPLHPAPRSLLLGPLFVVGCFVIRDRWVAARVVGTPIVVNAVVYSFYYVTALHPRFLYVTLPFVFVLEAAGALVGRRCACAAAARGATAYAFCKR